MNDKTVGIIRDLSWSYRDQKLFEHLSTRFPDGAFISLIGPNGSGKTTLLRHLLRLLPAPRHAILLPEGPLEEYPQKKLARHVSYVPQQSKLEYDFTVKECVAMGRYAHGGRLSTLEPDDQAIIEEALVSMDMLPKADRLATELSGGEYQRMLIARALCQQSRVILLDEPVNHLDVRHQRAMMELLGQLVLQGYTVVCVLHDLLLVQVYSQIALVLKKGKVVSYGPTQEVFNASLLEDVYHIKAHQVYDPTLGRSLWMPTWKETHENV